MYDTDAPSAPARAAADHTLSHYLDATVDTIAELVGFRTVAAPPMPNTEHPEFRRMKAYLARQSRALDLDFADHGAAVVIGLGRSDDRLGILTHGDVQPANDAAWASNPFCLDASTEPGRLVGRGVEDDKGSVATALYAMKALHDQGLALSRRVELIISMTEESDWEPFREFLRGWSPRR